VGATPERIEALRKFGEELKELLHKDSGRPEP
jgi:hypothetical protein